MQHNDQLPVRLLAQLVERCTGVAEVMDSNLVGLWKRANAPNVSFFTLYGG